MIANWWRNRRRRRLLARPIPDGWEIILRENVRQFAHLSPRERERLLDVTRILVAEKYWEGCNGLKLTDEIRVTIAGQAGLMLLGWDGRYFDHLKSILVYPDTYLAPERDVLPGGVVSESFGVRLGEAWQQGPVILSWANVNRKDNPGEPGQNVVLHEFAHVLDNTDETFNGTPLLRSDEQYATWRDVMTAEFHHLQRDARDGRQSLLDQYGAQNEAEFFAVAAESFFEQPGALRTRHERLYRLLCDYYGRDPASGGALTD
ncbi:MAG: zinc-dependent peptidase [Planctomycetaceae bacterium]